MVGVIIVQRLCVALLRSSAGGGAPSVEKNAVFHSLMNKLPRNVLTQHLGGEKNISQNEYIVSVPEAKGNKTFCSWDIRF